MGWGPSGRAGSGDRDRSRDSWSRLLSCPAHRLTRGPGVRAPRASAMRPLPRPAAPGPGDRLCPSGRQQDPSLCPGHRAFPARRATMAARACRAATTRRPRWRARGSGRKGEGGRPGKRRLGGNRWGRSSERRPALYPRGPELGVHAGAPLPSPPDPIEGAAEG